MKNHISGFLSTLRAAFFVTVALSLLVPTYGFDSIFAQSVDDIQDEIDQIEQEVSESEEILAQTQARIDEINSSNLSISQKIAALDEDISAKQTQLDIAQKQIEERVLTIEKQSDEIESKKEQITKIINRLYKDSNVSFLEMLLSGGADGEFLRSYFYRKQLVDSNVQTIQQINAAISELSKEKTQLEIEKKQIALEKESLDQSRAILENERAKIQQQIYAESLRQAQVRADIASMNKQLGTLSQELRDVIEDKGADDSGDSTGGGNTSGGTSPQEPIGDTGRYDLYIGSTKVASNTPGPIRAVGGSNNVFDVVGVNRYRGILEFRADSNVYMINELDFETYLKGIGEMPSSWDQDALRAQSVAARSYAARNWDKRAQFGYSLRDDVFDQNYVGYNKEIDWGGQWAVAVDATTGEVLKHNGSIIATFYHSTCGGHTLGSEEVWVSALPYTRPESDWYQADGRWRSYDSASKWSHWQPGSGTISESVMHDLVNATLYLSAAPTSPTRQGHVARWDVSANGLTPEEMRGALGAANTSESRVGSIQNVQAVFNNGSIRIDSSARKTTSLRITGSSGTVDVSAEHFWTVFNARSPGSLTLYYSNFWDVEKSGSNFIFRMRGYPHRVGMCQYGAQGRAKAGQSYQEILAHYYRGTQMTSFSPPAAFRVGITRVATGDTYFRPSQSSSLYSNGQKVADVSPGQSVRVVKR